MEHDLVSVYITTKNRLALLKRAVNSVVNQTYKNIEILIVDDGSADDTKDYLESLLESYNNVKVFYNIQSKGACYSRNLAIVNSTGRFVTGLDDDDYYYPDRIKCFIKAWKALNSDCAQFAGLFDSAQIVTQKKEFIGFSDRVVCFNDLLKMNRIGNQVFSLRSNFLEVGMFDERLPMWQDWDMWSRLSEKFGCFYNIKSSTYVVDQTHDFGRIYQKPVDVIEKTFDLFLSSKRYSVCSDKANWLYLAMWSYPQYKINFSEVVIVLLSDTAIKGFVLLAKRLIRKFLNHEL